MTHVDLQSGIHGLAGLKAGDEVLLSGIAYTARDAAHKRIIHALERGEETPFPLEGSVIFYAGPAPMKPGSSTTAVGPTTSYRMDPFTPGLFKAGVKAVIGKGKRAQKIADSCRENGAVYLIAVGGIAALLSKKIKKIEMFAYEDLGAEAVYKVEFDEFPCIIAIDSLGNDIYAD